METLQVKDKKFAVSIPEREILRQVKRVAEEINRDYAGREPLFLAVLNGSFIFAADLMREVRLAAQVSFVKLASYEGTSSTGAVSEVIGLNADVEGRDIVIVEDIIDSGLTMRHLTEMLAKRHPRSVEICSLLVKPENLKVDLDIRYRCFDIPNDFILGYGLDFFFYGTATTEIYTVVE